MRTVLVASRSFGKAVRAGEAILTEGGFEIRHIRPEEWPLDEAKMARIVAREDPEVIISGAEPMSAKVLSASRKLRMVMKHGVGVDNIDLDAATSRGIAVANAPGTNTAAVADLTIAAMLVLLRHLCEANRATKAGRWDRYMGHELGEMTVGVVGTGRIGAEVIRRLWGFGARILAYDVIENEELPAKFGVTYVPFERLLRESDIVTLHVPLMEQTRRMIGKGELRQMKKTACLINAARGELVDEDALFEHLRDNPGAAAALDVFSVEPPLQNPLLGLDNVLATPHLAAYTVEAMERMDRICAETILDTFGGKRCPNILNPAVLEGFSTPAGKR